MFTKTSVSHIRIICFLSSSPKSTRLHVGSSDIACTPSNGINSFKSGLDLQYLNAPASYDRVQDVYYSRTL